MTAFRAVCSELDLRRRRAGRFVARPRIRVNMAEPLVATSVFDRPAEGPHHLARVGGARRQRERDLREAPAARRRGPGQGHLPLRQLARRLDHRRHGDLRHHAVRPERHRHGRHRHGGLDGPAAAHAPARRASATSRPTRACCCTSPHGGFGGTSSDIQTQAQLILAMKKRLAEITAAQTGKTRRADQRRRRPRPLVHRPGGAGATASWTTSVTSRARRHRRRRNRNRVTGAEERTPNEHSPPSAVRRRATASQMPGSRYILPQFEERTAYGYKRQDPYNKLFEDRVIFLGVPGRRRVRRRRRWPSSSCCESQDPDRDIIMYINSPGGSFTAMTAIYDTMPVRVAADPDRRARPGGLRRRRAAGGRRSRQAPGAAERPDPHPPARDGRGRPRPGLRHRDPGRGRSCACATWLEETLATHSNKTKDEVNTRHRPRQDPLRARKPSPTVSSTRC